MSNNERRQPMDWLDDIIVDLELLRERPGYHRTWFVMALFVFVFLATIILLSLLGAGCGKGGLVCDVIDVAHYGCDVLPIRYLGADGKEHTVNVPKSTLVRTAEMERLAQANASLDAGVDAK